MPKAADGAARMPAAQPVGAHRAILQHQHHQQQRHHQPEQAQQQIGGGWWDAEQPRRLHQEAAIDDRRGQPPDPDIEIARGFVGERQQPGRAGARQQDDLRDHGDRAGQHDGVDQPDHDQPGDRPGVGGGQDDIGDHREGGDRDQLDHHPEQRQRQAQPQRFARPRRQHPARGRCQPGGEPGAH